MPTLKERIDAAKAKLEADKAKIAELEKKASEPPKRQASRDITQIREILVVEINLRRKYGCGYSGLAEIARKAKKDGMEVVVATGQRPNPNTAILDDDIPPAPPPPLPQQVTPAVGGVTSTAPQQPADPSLVPLVTAIDGDNATVERVDLANEPLLSPENAISTLREPEFDENDEPPVENTPELAAAQRDDLPWDD